VTNDARSELLTSLEHRLDALISGLESGVPEEALVGLWTTSNETFERFKAAQVAHADEPLPEELRRQLEGVFRLQVVVSSMAARLRDDLTLESEKVANARARLSSLTAKVRVGQSCDLAG